MLTKAKLAWVKRHNERLAAKGKHPSPNDRHIAEVGQTAETVSASVAESSQAECEVAVNPVGVQAAGPSGQSKQQEDTVQHESDTHLTSNLPVALRKPKRATRLPNRLQKDMLPVSQAIRIVEARLAQIEATRNEEALINLAAATSSSKEVQNSKEVAGPIHRAPERFVRSLKNLFHMFRQYDGTELPSRDPEAEITLDDLSDIQSRRKVGALIHEQTVDFGPYPNQSSFLLGEWFWKAGHQKSKHDFRSLLEILMSSDFDIDEIRRTHWEAIDRSLGASSRGSDPSEDDGVQALNGAGWFLEGISITIPFSSRSNESRSKPYFVGQFYRRSIVSVIRERVACSESRYLHFIPHEVYWQPEDEPPVRVHGELYNSPAFIDAHREVQQLKGVEGCQLPRVVIALMFASDETHLTQFGETKLWPLYMFLGNDSKYRRVKPHNHLCNHLAYFIKLPNTFKEFVLAENGTKGPSSALLAHLGREVIHAQWRAMLDDSFMEAYEHGIVEKLLITKKSCVIPPQQTPAHLLPPQFFLRAVLNSIRNLGNRPCPRCLIPKKEIHNLGLDSDKEWRTQHQRMDNEAYRTKITDTRNAIYKQNYVVDSKKAVEPILKGESLVPVETAFTTKLASNGFNFFGMAVVDLMHEIESGNWKSLFIQILRILETLGDHLTIELDLRYRQTPTFGLDSIRKFRRNVSQMKNLAARDWEDMLQCALPAFENLLPEPHNSNLLDLLFSLTHWHGFAKLRIHTDATLDLMERLTSNLGQRYRIFFASTCTSFATRELEREFKARTRRTGPKAQCSADSAAASISAPTGANPALPSPASGEDTECRLGAAPTPSDVAHDISGVAGHAIHVASSGQPDPGSDLPSTEAGPSSERLDSAFLPKAERGAGGRRPKTLNMNTYKFHSMGDYTNAIRRFGTTDSYSTESSELEHRTPKNRYSRTNKKDFVKQLVQIERRQARIRTIRHQIDDGLREAKKPAEVAREPAQRYWTGKSQNNAIFIPQFLKTNSNDPAIKGFFLGLKAHLASKVADHAAGASSCGSGEDSDTTPTVFIQRDTLYQHKTIRLNYTTYDLRRAQDVINPGKSSHNVMILEPIL